MSRSFFQSIDALFLSMEEINHEAHQMADMNINNGKEAFPNTTPV